MSKQRFLNQQLGKRMNRKADLLRAKLPAAPRRGERGPAGSAKKPG